MTKICPNCKKENLDNSEFCQNCGTGLNNTNNEKSNVKSESGLKEKWDNKSTGGKIALGFAACVIGLILIIAIAAMISPDKTTTNTTTPQNTTTQTQAAPLSSDSVNETLGGDSTVRSIDVTNGAVTVNYDLGFVNDNNDIIMKSSEDTINKMKKIFTDNRVTSVTIASYGTFTDPNGNDKDELAVSITVNKATADKTNWDGVNDMLASDPTDLLKISDGYSINPSVYNSISLDVPISK